jgi:CheY-like chemotaxis protein
MSYRALLFCPEPKTAQVVTQILCDLDFQVESCHEPLVAVKKLSEARWDAVVVDCADDQNAALLFKQARNSGSNSQALAVAVVDGKSGIAVAFRLGANLVLTKPISIEQSKSTLRVARRLLGANGNIKSDATTAPLTAFPTHIEQSTPTDSARVESATSVGSLPEMDPEPELEPAVAALYESDLPSAVETAGTANLESPALGPHSSSPVAEETGAAKLIPAPASSTHTTSASGAAAAPALAREADADAVEVEEPPAPIAPATSKKRTAKPANRKSGNTVQILVLVTLLIAAAAVGFVQWRNMHRAATPAPVVRRITLPPTAVAQPSPSGAAVPPSASPAVAGQSSTTLAVPAANPPQGDAATPAPPQVASEATDKPASPPATPTPKGKATGATTNLVKSSTNGKPR